MVALAAGQAHAGSAQSLSSPNNCLATCSGWQSQPTDKSTVVVLGDGTTTNKPWPTEVQGQSSLHTIHPGGYHACAMTTLDSVECWGWNWAGQLGDGATINRLTPTAVMSLTDRIRDVAAGENHSCAVTVAGGVWCWGFNGTGQLGDGTTTNRLIPVSTLGLITDVQSVATGRYHSCALTTAGGVQCWGWNVFGQLGDGTLNLRMVPGNVIGLTSGIQALATGGDHACALTAIGGVKCWGWNGYGQLGDGTGVSRTTPVDVIGLSGGVRAVTAGGTHTCALMATGGVRCWGNNLYGQLGDGTTTNRWTSVAVAGLPDVVRTINAGVEHTCALAADDSIWCWGSNASGQLGDGTNTDRLTPVQVVQMPVFDCAAVSEIPQNECHALLALADHANRHGWAGPTMPVGVKPRHPAHGMVSPVRTVMSPGSTCATTTCRAQRRRNLAILRT